MTNATIQEIEGIDDYWGPAFRSIYEGEGHEAFVQQLDERIKQHDKEIEKLCNFHYQGFIDSIRELLQVRSHAEELHADISNVEANVKETTENLYVKAEELLRARRVELNIAATIEKMELCLPLLTTYSKLKSQVEAKRYYPALKTLEQLEHVLLPRVGPYKWCGQISADIPRLRQAIQDASMADLRDFLENIRKLSPQVGAMALKQTQEMLGRNLASIVKNKKDMAALGVSVKENTGPQCPHELVDFSPLHRCLHIHSVLGAKNDFIQYYRAQRKQQARLVLIPESANLHDSIPGIRNYLNAVLGFFILEEHLLSAGAGLVSKDWLLDMWSMSVTKVASTLRTNTSLITDPTLMLSIKHQITAGSMFQAARDDAEQQICDNLEKKVDEFLDLENYDWLLVEPTGQASAFVTDMLSYLSGVLTSLEQLPERARVAAVRAATNRIARRLRALLLDPAVKQVSSGALDQLNLDVIQCEQFAAGEPVPGLKEGELLEHFASLRQLLDLITGWDWSSYLHDVGIDGGKYALVTPRDAATLLEKLKEAEQKSSVFSVLKKNERDRRKLLDTVLKQLKQLQNQDGS
ncbi:unnamed protein product [Arctia plantaginis]|uniref:Exocyst complex component 6 n=1 Tax=Arctia plantaginis TaxID=874455 RepID=A0A8S0YW69_ARCPL|nr:unnamed protein product [Arctia plantaginis]